MNLMPVTCNNCGAALEVSEIARYVTCGYCKSRLEIKRTGENGAAIFTEVLERIDRNTAGMADDLHAIRRESELERLDREWDAKRQSLSTTGKDGSRTAPTVAGGLVGAFVMGGFGVFWTIMAFVITSGGPAPQSPAIPGFPGSGSPFPAAPERPAVFDAAHVIFPLFGILFIAFAIFMGAETVAAAGKYEDEQRQYQRRREELLAAGSGRSPAQ